MLHNMLKWKLVLCYSRIATKTRNTSADWSDRDNPPPSPSHTARHIIQNSLLVPVLNSNMSQEKTPQVRYDLESKVNLMPSAIHFNFIRFFWIIKSFVLKCRLLGSFLFALNNKWLSCTNVSYTSSIHVLYVTPMYYVNVNSSFDFIG